MSTSEKGTIKEGLVTLVGPSKRPLWNQPETSTTIVPFVENDLSLDENKQLGPDATTL